MKSRASELQDEHVKSSRRDSNTHAHIHIGMHTPSGVSFQNPTSVFVECGQDIVEKHNTTCEDPPFTSLFCFSEGSCTLSYSLPASAPVRDSPRHGRHHPPASRDFHQAADVFWTVCSSARKIVTEDLPARGTHPAPRDTPSHSSTSEAQRPG